QDLLAAGADHDLVGGVVQVVVADELAAHRLAQPGNAGYRRITGLVARQRLDDRRLDVGRRLEIGFAYGEPDDVTARGAQIAHPLRGKRARRHPDAGQAGRITDRGHDAGAFL